MKGIGKHIKATCDINDPNMKQRALFLLSVRLH